MGYSKQSGIPLAHGFTRNHYIGRTFINPVKEMRSFKVKIKLNPIPEIVGGKRVVVVDDSIVRGSTSGPIVDLLRRNGAREVHMRICSPPIRWSCHFGVDMARKDELIAAHLQVEDIRRHIGADSLGYLSLEGMIGATGATTEQLCSACFTGDYPMTVQLELDKGVLERA